MPKLTENYSFKKPLGTESALISVLNENFDAIDEALTPSVDDTVAPAANVPKGKLSGVLGWIANRIKAITGKSKWYEAPSINLETVAQHIGSGTHPNATQSVAGFMSAADKKKLDGATASNTTNTVMLRDSSGRAKVSNPSSSYDIANKTYVDTNCVRKNYAATMGAILTAQSNSSYTTKQVRNIVFWTSGDTPPSTSNGDIVIKLF